MKKTLRILLGLAASCCAANSIAGSDNADAAQAAGRISFAGTVVSPTCSIVNNKPDLTILCPGSIRNIHEQAFTESPGTQQTEDGLSTISFRWLNITRTAGISTVTSV